MLPQNVSSDRRAEKPGGRAPPVTERRRAPRPHSDLRPAGILLNWAEAVAEGKTSERLTKISALHYALIKGIDLWADGMTASIVLYPPPGSGQNKLTFPPTMPYLVLWNIYIKHASVAS